MTSLARAALGVPATPLRAAAPIAPLGDLAEAREVLADPESRTPFRIAAARTLMATGKKKNSSKVVDALFDVESRSDFLDALLPIAQPALLDESGAYEADVIKRVRRLAASKKVEWKVHGLRLGAMLELDGLDSEAMELLGEAAKHVLRNDRREPEDRADMRAARNSLSVACAVLARNNPPDPQFLWQLQLLRDSAVVATRQLAYEAYVSLGAARYADVLARAVGDEAVVIQDLAYHALVEAQRPELVPALVVLLGERPDAGVNARILPRLFRATGQRYLSRSQWDKWLGRNEDFLVFSEEEFELAQNALVEAFSRSRYGPQGSFFTRPVAPSHAVFLLDVSGSMSARVGSRNPTSGVEIFLPKDRPRRRRMDLMKSQVINALEGLTDQDFDIIVFSTDVRRWRAGGNRAFDTREAALESATSFVRDLQQGGGTALHEGLETALSIEGVKQVFLLTDGTPTEGVRNVARIVRDTTRWSKQAGGVTLHCIALGVVNPLLKELANATKNGTYVEVEVSK